MHETVGNHGMKKQWKDWSLGMKILAIAGGSVGGVGLLALFGFVVMWLWNWLMPAIFKLPPIGYWQGWGLVALASIFFGRMHGSNHGEDRRRKRKLRERMNAEGSSGPGASLGRGGENASPSTSQV